MHDLTKADEIYNKMSTDEKVNKTFKIFKEKMPTEFCRLMYLMEYGCHIVTPDLYNDAINCLEWFGDRGQGAKWSTEEIIKASGIDFDSLEHKEKKKYTKYDFAFMVNYNYSKYCNIISDTSYYLKMSKNDLENENIRENPSEHAYHKALKLIKMYE